MGRDAAHDAFMTLPPYIGIREGQARQLGRGPKPHQGWPRSEEIPSSKQERRKK
jgi:hypothetical protein